MDSVKEAFLRVSEDISELKKDRDLLEGGVVENRKKLFEICDMLADLTLKLQIKSKNNDFNSRQTGVLNTKNNQQTPKHIQETQEKENNNNFKESPMISGLSIYSLNKAIADKQTDIKQISTHLGYTSTYNLPLSGPSSHILAISKGNQGVKTNRQTNRQTDKTIENKQIIEKNTVDSAIDILSSLDSVRKRLRLDFKALTDQEWLVFSTLYTLEEEQGYADYRSIASKLSLTESSIRDYIGRLIKKGIPVDKKKVNNKNISLSISPNLKKVAPLHQILELREIK